MDYKRSERFYIILLNVSLVILLFLITIIYFSGGISFSFLSFRFRSHSIVRPFLLLVFLFLLKTITDKKWREFLLYLFSVKGMTVFLLVSISGMANGIFSYDMENTGRIFDHLSLEGFLNSGDVTFTKCMVFYLTLYFSVWIIYSRVVSRIRAVPVQTILNRDGLIMGIGILHLFPLIQYKTWIDPQYIFFLSVLIPGMMAAFKTLLSRSDEDRVAGENYLKALIIISAAYFILFSVLSVQKYTAFRSQDDFPIYIQSLWTTLKGNFLYVNWFIFPDEAGRSYLGHHMEPIILFYLPFYATFKDPRVLLVLQSLLLTAAAIPVYKLAEERLKNSYIAFCLALSYLLTPLIQRVHLYDFHPYGFEPLMIVLTFYFMLKRKTFQYFISMAILLVIKEHMSIFVVLFGIYAIIFLKQKKIGIITILIGVLYFILAVKIVIPYFRGSDMPYHTLAERYGYLGKDFYSIIKTFLTKPWIPLSRLTDGWGLRGWGYLLIPVAFLPFMSIKGFILVLPATSIMLLSDFVGLRYLGLNNPVSVVPFYMIGSVISLENLVFKKHRMLPFIGKIKKKYGIRPILTAFGSFILTASLFFNYHFNPLPPSPFKFDLWMGSHHLSPSPTGKYFDADLYRMNEHDRKGVLFINQIKKTVKDSPMSVELRFASHFSDRFLIRELHYPGWERAEYIFFDIYGEPLENLYDHKRMTIRILEGKEFGVVAERDGYVLLRRGADPCKNDNLIKEISGRIEAEDIPLRTGSNTFDLDAINKKARFGKAGIDGTDLLIFGHYINLTKGNYRAIFRIKTKAETAGEPIAIIEIAAEGGKIVLQKKELKGIDFSDRNSYKEIALAFSLNRKSEVEPRVYFTSKSDLWVDKITIVRD